jgi:hypothetical protein
VFSNVAVATEVEGPDIGNTLPPQLLAARGSQTFTFAWTPSGGVSGSSQCPNLLAIFAQAYAIADGHSCPGQWFKNDFSYQSVYNAGQVFAYTPGS